MKWIIPIAAAAFLAASANAQVHRCKDASGKTIYSDAPCGAGQTGQMIERQRTEDEIAQEREQAYEAEMLKRQRNMAEQQRELAEQRRYPVQAPVVRHSGNDWAQRKALENAATSSGSITSNGGRWDKSAEARRAQERRDEARLRPTPPPPPPQPTAITSCKGGFCNDDQGGVYHRSGPNFMTGPNGQPCHRAGTVWNCN